MRCWRSLWTACVLLALSGTAEAQEPGIVVAEFAGVGDSTTSAFEVPEGWLLQWSTTGEKQLYILVETPDGARVDGVSGVTGRSREPYAGRFRLTISTLQPWKVRVLRPGN